MPILRPLLLFCLLLAALAAPPAAVAQAPDPNADTEEPWLEGYIPDDLPDDDVVGRDPSTYEPDPEDLDADLAGELDGEELDGGTSAAARKRAAHGLPTTSRKTVAGRRAMLRTDGTAAIPRNAPRRVRDLIRAINRIIGKPHKRRGGHGRRLSDSGYDAAGAVGYALVKARAQRKVVSLKRLRSMHRSRAGRDVTVYVSAGHAYLEVAGLRLDTSAYRDASARKGVQWRPVVGKRRGFTARHPAGL